MPHRNAGRSPLVLEVDDSDDAREVYAALLSAWGFRVAEASTGREAVDLAVDLLPDVILMDLSMPELDGLDATRLIKRDARTRHIPVLLFTCHDFDDHVREARQAGCDAFLAKPCSPDVVRREIQSLLASREARGEGVLAG